MKKVVWRIGVATAAVEILTRIGLYGTGLTAPTYWPLEYLLPITLGVSLGLGLDRQSAISLPCGEWNFRNALKTAVATVWLSYGLSIINLFFYHGFISDQPLRDYIDGQVHALLADPSDPDGKMAVEQMVLVMNSWEALIVVLVKGWLLLLLPAAFAAWVSTKWPSGQLLQTNIPLKETKPVVPKPQGKTPTGQLRPKRAKVS